VPGVVILRNRAFIDVTAVEMLDQLADTLESEGVALRVARDTGGVRDVLRRAGSEPRLQRVYGSVRAPVEASRLIPMRLSSPSSVTERSPSAKKMTTGAATPTEASTTKIASTTACLRRRTVTSVGGEADHRCS
jgi:hypothetical protein